MTTLHGGAHWQPHIHDAADYDRIVAADVNDAWYPPALGVLQVIAEWSNRVNHSPDSSCQALLDALEQHFSVPGEAIRIGAGSSDLLHHIVLTCAGPGDLVLTLDPTYAEYARAAVCAGAAVRTVCLDPENRFACSVEALIEAAAEYKPRLIALCNPNNPTGGILSRADILRLAEAAGKGVTILVDEAYIDFAPQESVFAEAARLPNLAVVKTFSKAYAIAGLRVGYAALGEFVRARFDQKGRIPWPVGLLGLRAAEAALKERAYIETRIAEYSRLKDRLIRSLPLPVLRSSTHYFLMDLSSAKIKATHLLEKLRRQGVFLRDFSGFSSRSEERFIRITTQSAPGNDRISLSIKQILE